MPIVTGYEDTPGGHDALVLGAQLTRLTGLGAIVATVYPTDGRGLAGAARPRPPLAAAGAQVALARFARAREFIGAGWGATSRSSSRSGRARSRRVLTDFADEVGAAVLVVGSTGHGLLGRIAPGANGAAAAAHQPLPDGDRAARLPAHRRRGHPLRRRGLRRVARGRPRRR